MLIELMAAAVLANGCPEPRPGEPAPVSANPDWLIRPSPDDIYWAYPSRAVAEELPGRATIECEVTEQGAAEACTVVSEEPKGYGFGEAAIRLTTKMLFKPRLQCGSVARATIKVPIAFTLPQSTAAPSTAPLDPANRKLSLASRLVAALKLPALARDSSDSALADLMQTIDEERGAAEQKPLTAAERQVLHDTGREIWAENESRMLNAVVRHYAAALTEEELNASLAFFESPAGQKTVDAIQEMEGVWSSLVEALSPGMFMSFRRRICERSASLCEEGEL